jgi:homocysteine S-methyltransferase
MKHSKIATEAAALPQLQGKLFLADGGIETTLIFHEGIDLPHNAAFILLRSEEGKMRLRDYFEPYIAVAKEAGTGLVLESATWRSNPDWAARIGVGLGELDQLNREAILLLHKLRAEHATGSSPIVISGCVGPRGDGYRPEQIMTADEAQGYHTRQIEVFRDAGADMIAAITMTNIPEAIGIARAAEAAEIPVAISFTVETDGRLPTGMTLKAAIAEVDEATGGAPSYYMINCAHPSHFAAALAAEEPWVKRIKGIRANASRLSHADLDEASELDTGNPEELGREHRELFAILPHLAVMGGCCGTDHRHVRAIAKACATA